MPLPLSVLDLVPIASGGTASEALAHSLELARLADGLGFTRYWVAEHHNTSGLASSSPEILIAMLARETRRLRVGSGGIMLPNHSPLKVAESFRTLEALFPGRIDLGLGRAPGTDQLTALALRRSTERLAADDFPLQVQELQAYAGEAPMPEDLPFGPVVAAPDGVPLPPLWFLSSSGYGARMAARLGRGFAFAHHFSPAAALPSMRAYRAEFRPSAHLERPHAILAVSVICAATEERAEALARCVDLMWIRFMRNERKPLPSVEEARDYPYTPLEREQARSTRQMLTVGTPEQVRARLEALAAEMGADELMVNSHVPVHAERLRSYQLLARAFGLPRGDLQGAESDRAPSPTGR
jgi:luciferase family oxidoreductase group 1